MLLAVLHGRIQRPPTPPPAVPVTSCVCVVDLSLQSSPRSRILRLLVRCQYSQLFSGTFPLLYPLRAHPLCPNQPILRDSSHLESSTAAEQLTLRAQGAGGCLCSPLAWAAVR